MLDGYLRGMSHLKHAVQKRLVRLVLAGGLLTGAIGAPLVLTGGTAQAVTCNVGSPCTLAGQLALTAGPLSLITASALGWSGTETGSDLNLYDMTGAHETYSVIDATGSGAGWHVTTAATTFTSTTPAATLPNTGTFSTNGSTGSISSTNAPAFACTVGSTCVLPTIGSGSGFVGYPVPITTAGSTPPAATVFDDAVGTGLGAITISSVGWWLDVLANAKPATYTSTVTMQVVAGP